MLLRYGHHAWLLPTRARAMRRLLTRRGAALVRIDSPARALRAALARLDDDRELTAVKIGLLGLLVLAAAAVECLWT